MNILLILQLPICATVWFVSIRVDHLQVEAFVRVPKDEF